MTRLKNCDLLQAVLFVSVKKIDSNLYEQYKECIFGTQVVSSVQLCSMLKRKGPGGYYHVEHEVELLPSGVVNRATCTFFETSSMSLLKPPHV